MNSLIFLLVKSVKNSILEIFRKPAKLIIWALTIVGVVGIFVLSIYTRQHSEDALDLVWLQGIFFMLIFLFVVLAVKKGLSNGDVIFNMNDVNLLFVSPVSSRAILMYGIVRMAKTALLAGFFILFQSNSLSAGFGIGVDSVFLILLGFIIAVSTLQILSLLIYSLTNGKPARKKVVWLIFSAILVPLIITIGTQLATAGDLLTALENVLRSPIAAWTPVAGWASKGIVALISGNIGDGFLFFGLILFTGAALILYIALSNPDYYEDVLVATETAFERKRSISEGQINTEASSAKKVKITGTGVGGFGSSAIFYKHIRESFRANLLGLWGVQSILTVSGAVIVSLFLRGDEGGVLLLLQILMWAQIFLIGTGRGLKELYSHYIYLIPESSFSKIVWSNLEIVFKVLVESFIIFGVAGAIMGESILLIAVSISVYTLFSLLLLGINYLSLRWTGADISMGLLMFIYILGVIVIMLPGLIAAIVIGSIVEGIGLLIGLAILAAWELIAALTCFAMSKGILHNCDISDMKAVK